MSCYPVLYFERPLTAVVLCGGLSTRMGTDKGLILSTEELTWAQKLANICKGLLVDTIVSIGKTQQQTYLEYFPSHELVLDIHTQMGPLGGLFSVHNSFPDHDLLVLSCDMQALDASIIYHFLSQHNLLGEFDAVVSQKDGFYQPFPGLYSAELLHKVSLLHQTNQIQNHSLQKIFQDFYVYDLLLPQEHSLKIKSYNSPSDLEDLSK
jgi:molybdenum cofactor guanylyltransferase